MDAIQNQARKQILDLFVSLGFTAEERAAIIAALAEHTTAKPELTREQLVAMDIPSLMPFIKALQREDLDQAFLCMFPAGKPSMLTRIDMEAFIQAAVVKERAIKGLVVTL